MMMFAAMEKGKPLFLRWGGIVANDSLEES